MQPILVHRTPPVCVVLVFLSWPVARACVCVCVQVVSSAGTVCVRYIVQHVPAPRLLPVLVTNLTTHKSKEIRATLSEVLLLLLRSWPRPALDRHQAAIADAIRKACADADSTARNNGRK